MLVLTTSPDVPVTVIL